MSNPSTSGTAYLLLASHVKRLGEDRAFEYYEKLDKNLAQVTKSGGAPGRMAASGETPIAIALAYEVDVARKQGAPIDVIYPTDGVAWTFEGNALVKGTKNPQNGRRFLDWAMSRSAMDAYVKWRGSGITRPDLSVTGAMDIRPGELVSLVGGSGCGKTTTLRMIAGFETPDSGDILFDGRVVNGVSPRKRGLGIVFQSYALFPTMTVGENIAFGLRIARWPD